MKPNPLFSSDLILLQGAATAAAQRLKLEVEPEAKLHCAWSIALPWQGSETVGAGAGVQIVSRAWVEEDGMVEKVYDDHLELEIEALHNLEVLSNAHVHVPVGKAAYHAPTAVLGVQTKYRLTELIECGI